MLIKTNELINKWDQFTIEDQKIDSLKLLKRASKCFSDFFIRLFPQQDLPVTIVCGNGNNGADGIAVAIYLSNAFYDVTLCYCKISKPTTENLEMLELLKTYPDIKKIQINPGDALTEITFDPIIIDALFGSGLNRPVINYWAEVIAHINQSKATIISIDNPSGLQELITEKTAIIKADHCGTFQSPNLAQLIPENDQFVGKLEILDIGLSKRFKPLNSFQYYIELAEISPLILTRKKYQHKGDFGHILAICGSKGMAGAAIFAARAALRSGVGKLTVCVPNAIDAILQMAVPEAMTIEQDIISSENILNHQYDTFLCGCGIGINKVATETIDKLLKLNLNNLILDADALNIISQNGWQSRIPRNAVITPHIKEFERLFGHSENSLERIINARKIAVDQKIFIVLKGAHSSISTPEGFQYFNSTGNPGMATAGSGDVLSGIIAGLIAQKYPHKDACIIGTFLHGLAGDYAVNHLGQNALIASDIIDYIATAFKILNEEN